MNSSLCIFESEPPQSGLVERQSAAFGALVAPGSKLPAQACRYQIMRRLGRGAMGEVFVARDTRLDRNVALKFLLADGDEGEESCELLFREARAAAALDHPYVCKIYEIGEIEGRAFIAMEYVQGETLKQRLARGNMDIMDALRVALEMTEAMEFAHSQGIVYRDLKPSNIMLAMHGHIKVMDFGIASRLPAADDAAGTPESRSDMRGSVPYMSPEQLSGQPADPQSDIFCFGIVLYEMLTGRHPFRRSCPAATVAGILYGQPAPLRDSVAGVPRRLDYIVRKTLAKEPARRYPTMKAVRSDLRQVFDPMAGMCRNLAGPAE